MKKHKKTLSLTSFLVCLWSNQAISSNICNIVRGSYVLAQDSSNTFLGTIDNKFNAKSIFNEFGNYGSKYSSESIWNDYGSFGGKYSSHSPFNNMSTTPPMIVKDNNIIGYLSSNKHISNSINPSILKAMCEDEI